MRRKRLLLILAGMVLALGVILAELNVLDYQQFHGAIEKADRLSAGECLAMADFCQRARREREYGAVEAPPPFRPVDPRGVRVSPGEAEVVLYELGDLRVMLWVERAGANQRVRYTVRARPMRPGRVLWTRLPEESETTTPWRREEAAVATSSLSLPWWCLWRRLAG